MRRYTGTQRASAVQPKSGVGRARGASRRGAPARGRRPTFLRGCSFQGQGLATVEYTARGAGRPGQPALARCSPQLLDGALWPRRTRPLSIGATVSRMVRPASSTRTEMKIKNPVACRQGRTRVALVKGVWQTKKMDQAQFWPARAAHASQAPSAAVAGAHAAHAGTFRRAHTRGQGRGSGGCPGRQRTCMTSMARPMLRRSAAVQLVLVIRMMPQTNTPRSQQEATISGGGGWVVVVGWGGGGGVRRRVCVCVWVGGAG